MRSFLRHRFPAHITCKRWYSPAISHLTSFQSIVGPDYVLSDAENMEKYTVDWLHTYRGGSLVCLPSDTQQVSDIMSYCHEHEIGVVCQGGNTGLVGGSVGTHLGELVLSMARMNQILAIDTTASTISCEAGCVLEALNEAASGHQLQIPLDLGAKGSCMIGGNLATNAGGLRVIKFGSLHNALLGMEVVLADGQVLDMRTLHKDNTGYHLNHLMIGSEGTLGVITKVCLKLVTLPVSVNIILARLRAFSSIYPLLQVSRQQLGDSLNAFEFMDAKSIEAVGKASPQLLGNVSQFVPAVSADSTGYGDEPICVLLEVAGAQGDIGKQQVEGFLEHVYEHKLVDDALLSQDSAQARALWSIREHVPVALMTLSRRVVNQPVAIHSKLFKYDLSLSLQEVPLFLNEVLHGLSLRGYPIAHSTEQYTQWAQHCKGSLFEVFTFGHAGDQNIHLNFIAHFTLQGPVPLQEHIGSLQDMLEDVIYPLICKRKGSLSAEHGIGQQKKKALLLTRSPVEVDMMKRIKRAFDPKNILNPGKVLCSVSEMPA